jgi:phosphate-selective porin
VPTVLLASEDADSPRYRFPITGYVQVQWKSTFEDNGIGDHGFVLRRARLKYEHSMLKDFRAEVEVGFDELSLALKDAYFEYQVWPLLKARAGLFKMGFSREELTAVRNLLMAERTMTNDEFTDPGFLGRDIGLAVEARLLKNPIPVCYALGVFNGNRADLFQDDNFAKQFCERLTIEPVDELELGLNATQRNDSLTGKLANAYGGDLAFESGRTTANAELLVADNLPGRTMLGAHLTAGYRIGRFEPGLRVERFYPDITETGDWTTLVTAGLNWYVHRLVQLKLNAVAEFRPGEETGYEILVQAQAGP